MSIINRCSPVPLFVHDGLLRGAKNETRPSSPKTCTVESGKTTMSTVRIRPSPYLVSFSPKKLLSDRLSLSRTKTSGE